MEDKSLFVVTLYIHQQVREFVESQRRCKVISVRAHSASDYKLRPGSNIALDEMSLVHLALSFEVDAIELQHYRGITMKVEVVSDESLNNCQMVIVGERLG